LQCDRLWKRTLNLGNLLLGKILPIGHATTLQLSSVRLTRDSRHLDRRKTPFVFLLVQPFYFDQSLPGKKSLLGQKPLNGMAEAKECQRQHPANVRTYSPRRGNGSNLIPRNYADHLIVINCEISGITAIEFARIISRIW
jgi:hypothetical protein